MIETDLTGSIPRLKPAMLLASVVLLVGSLLLSRHVYRVEEGIGWHEAGP